MADTSVFITGAAKGSFTEALSELPPWATENTANKIASILSDTLKLQTSTLTKLVKGSSGQNMSPEKIKQTNDELDELIKNFKKENDEQKKKKDRWKDDDDEANKVKKRRQTAASYNTRAEIIGGILIDLGVQVDKVFRENFDTYTKLNEAGLNLVAGFDKINLNDSIETINNGADKIADKFDQVSDGFNSLQHFAQLTGVRFTELSATLQKYNTAINAFTTGKFANTVKLATKGMAEFGFSSKESAELLSSYLESQLGYTDIQNRSAQEVSEQLQNFGDRVMRLSLVTGMARTAILGNLEAITKSTEASVLQGQVGTDAAESTLEFIASIKNQNFGRQLLKLMTDSIKPLNETFMSFQKIGQGGFAQKLQAFTASLKGLDPAEQAQAIKAFEQANHAEIEHNKQLANLYSQVPELAGEANKALETYAGLQQTAREVQNLSAEDLDRLKKTNAARANLNTQWEKLMSSLQKMFAPTIPMLQALTWGLEKINDLIDGVIDGFSWIDDKIDGLAKTFGINVDKINSLDWVGFIAAAAAMITGASLIKKAFGNIAGIIFGGGKNAVARGVAGRALGGGIGSGAGGMLDSIGKGIGSIGKGIGTGLGGLIEGTLTGLATGLKALGDPKVLLGTVALGLIAGSLWITGKAVKEFVSLDWETLAKAGVALLGLGVLGAAAGVFAPEIALGALALGLMGAALWVVGKAMQEIGPGLKMTADGFKEFGDINGANLIAVAGGITALGLAMAAFSTAMAAASIGNVFTSILGGNKLQDMVSTINSIDVSKANALTNVLNSSNPGSAKQSTLNSPSEVSTKNTDKTKNSPSAGTKDTDSSTGNQNETNNVDINTTLKYQSSLLEQILTSQQNMISVNKDILKYTKVNTG